MASLINKKLTKEFILYTQENLIYPLTQQQSCGIGPRNLPPRGQHPFWCCDWWTLEVAKVLYLGSYDRYCTKKLPIRLRRLCFRPDSIASSFELKFATLELIHKIHKDCDNLLIAEVGRGLEILLALSVKLDWKRIVCYDGNKHYEEHIRNFFTMFEGELVYKMIATNAIIYKKNVLKPYVNNKTLVIATRAHWKEDTILEFFPDAAHIIRDGVLVK